ncbi:uncharacterized protein LOC106165058 [Lingula anatina]|uniref:Uncharacterized protein LOC106165058 n=1 Tax=Lingula anatina TaxID=7574 RepID=A0A1S3IK73_LINAN|nr:uncharacterized protein LOC106165058 [Lingula anatina]|eukprot:XP_013398607.1 uncharacterized protein LOC106165058 [Lingula anatina]
MTSYSIGFILTVAMMPARVVSQDYIKLGCWADTSNRAIPTLEGKDPILDGSYRARRNAIEKCYQAARKRGYKYFALQHSGWCASSCNAGQTYMKYGPSTHCQADGEGGPWANQLYQITGGSECGDGSYPYADSFDYLCYRSGVRDCATNMPYFDMTSVNDINAKCSEMCGFPLTVQSLQELMQLERQFTALAPFNCTQEMATTGQVSENTSEYAVIKYFPSSQGQMDWIIDLRDTEMTSRFINPPIEGRYLKFVFQNQEMRLDFPASISGQAICDMPSNATVTASAPAKCVIVGDPHVTNLDGKQQLLNAVCRVILSETCVPTKPGEAFLQPFSVTGRNRPIKPGSSRTYIEELTFKMFATTVDINVNGDVKVNGVNRTATTARVYIGNGLQLYLASLTIGNHQHPAVFVEAPNGLKVALTVPEGGNFKPGHHAEITTPAEYAGKLCGVCGNFNGDPNDDDEACYGQSPADCDIWHPSDGSNCPA